MFGNPFKKFPSAVQFPNEKCRWCLSRIGLEGRFPIPLCGKCFDMARENNTPGSPKGNLYERMFDEFPAEGREWAKRMRTEPTTLDLMESTAMAQEEVAELRRHAQRLRLAGDVQLAGVMEARAKERLEALGKFKTEAPGLLADLGRES